MCGKVVDFGNLRYVPRMLQVFRGGNMSARGVLEQMRVFSTATVIIGLFKTAMISRFRL